MSTEPLATINEDDITWDYKGKRHFESGPALAFLLVNEVCIALPLKDGGGAALLVLCNDVFMWACSECMTLPYDEIEPLYEMVRKDPEWGSAVWCCQQRKEMPQKPVADYIRKAGIWDLDAMDLEPNRYDAICRKLAEERRAKEAVA